MEEILLEHLSATPTNILTTKGVKKVTKSVSPLKGIREGLEDMLNIQQLKDLVMGFNNMRTDKKNQEVDNQQNNNNNNNMAFMMPFIQKMQSGNSKIDPLMMSLLMGMMGKNNNNSGGGNDMGQLLLMMNMANMFNQNNQGNHQNQGNKQNQGNQQNQGGINPVIFKNIIEEMQNVIQKQTQQNQQPTIDPNMILLLNMMNKTNGNPEMKTSNTVEVLLDKFNSIINNNQTQQMNMIMQQNQDKWERSMEMMAGAFNRERPEDRFMKNFELFRNITGDQRQKSTEEMGFDLKRQELVL